MATIGEVTAVLKADTAGLTGGVGRAVDALGDLGSALGISRGAVTALGAAGAAIAAGGLAAATAQAAEFERTIAGAAARAGATQQAFNAFGEAAKQASLDSAFGANEAGGALRFLAKSGFEVEEATAALPGILKGATAAGMEAADMGRIASDALKAFGKSADDTGEIMDVLVKGATSANTSVEELGQGISVVGGLANSAGVSIEEVVATMASMQDAGVSASRAAVAMRAGMARLMKPTDEVAGAMSELGVSAHDAQGNFRGLIPILTDLEAAGASNAQMLEIFGTRAGPTLQTALAKGAGALSDFQGELEDSGGTTDEVAGMIEDTLTEQINILTGSLETLGANIGESVIPILKAAVTTLQFMVNASNAVVDAVQELASTLSGGFLTSVDSASESTEDLTEKERELEKAQKDVKDATKDTNKALADHAGKADSAAEATGGLTKEIRDLQEELDKLEKKRKNADTLFGRAMAELGIEPVEEELQRKQTLAQGKEAQKRLPELQKRLERVNTVLDRTRSKLQGAQSDIELLAGSDLKGVSHAFQVDNTAGMSSTEVQALEDALVQRERMQRRLEQTQKARADLNSQIDETISKASAATVLELNSAKAAEDRKKQEQEITRQKQEQSRISQGDFDPTGGLRTVAGGLARGSQGLFGLAAGGGDALQGAMAGRSPGQQRARRTNLNRAAREMRRTSERKQGAARRRQEMRGAGGEQTAPLQDFVDTLTDGRFREGVSDAIGLTEDAAGQLFEMGDAVARLTGASDQAVAAMDGVGGALQSVLGGLASGSIFGAVSGIIGGITKAIGAAAKSKAATGGQGVQDGGQRRSRRNQRDLAKMIGEAVADSMREVPPVTQQISVDARAGLRPNAISQPEARQLENALERVRRLRSG